MEAIVERGGWVIRLGDPGMKTISHKKNTIDYAHIDAKTDWMDVFLGAACRCFLGSASGLSNISSVFGVPSAIANQAPMSVVLPYLPEDIGIPKLVYSLGEERYLNMCEILGSSTGNYRFDYLYRNARLCTIDNTAEDIRELVIELLDRIDGKSVYTKEDERLQERFKSLMNSSHYSYGSPARVGRDFLRKYSHLLDHTSVKSTFTKSV
jgi:putative glycosyltransferase (TIGR04372 family)